MSYRLSPFEAQRQKIILDILDKYPNSSTRQLARMLKNEYPRHFDDIEYARSKVRYYRGAQGDQNRKDAKNHKKYFRDVKLA